MPAYNVGRFTSLEFFRLQTFEFAALEIGGDAT